MSRKPDFQNYVKEEHKRIFGGKRGAEMGGAAVTSTHNWSDK
jgi:hypothetical protein